ncbi:MAG TPA: phosphate transport system regulatory protein PhoU [Verrucomicrobia bacterium]|nr:phosphate transport system regulatory protein PhoU [Verrucomicrobiota bacterium]
MYFFKEMGRVKTDILELCAMVEDRLHKAVVAVVTRDAELARTVIEADQEIDAKEVDIEEELLKIMALNQPVAVDLRFLVATLKINSDLERIGDLAVNIAERALVLNRKVHDTMPVDLSQMSEAVKAMLRRSIDALVNIDAEAARAVCRDDDAIDQMKHEIDDEIKVRMTRETEKDAIDVLVALLRVTRDLERISDHATNIAEDLIYISDGRIVRHHVTD